MEQEKMSIEELGLSMFECFEELSIEDQKRLMKMFILSYTHYQTIIDKNPNDTTAKALAEEVSTYISYMSKQPESMKRVGLKSQRQFLSKVIDDEWDKNFGKEGQA